MWADKSTSLWCLERYEEAVESYDQAIARNPEHPQTWINRGIALQDMEQYEEAIAQVLVGNTHTSVYSEIMRISVTRNIGLVACSIVISSSAVTDRAAAT
ncbi:MAG: tetratricopeptide repeat protein [Cyanobacteria bacterium P01_F01_bin.150]